MKVRSFFALAALTFSPSAFGQELEASASASTTGPAPAPAVGRGDGFASPNGQLGAGLSISKPEGAARAFGELGFYTSGQSFEFGDTEISFRVWSFSILAGGGYKIAPNIEIDAMLPLAFVHASVSASGDGADDASDSETEVAVGNLHVGASYLRAEGPLRLKIGGALQYGIWTIDPSDEFALTLGYASLARGGQDQGLWAPETLSIVTPSRVEYGDQVVFTGDGQLGLHLPTDGRDAEFSVQLNPGVGYYANANILVGGRVLFLWIPTESGDSATQFGLEPYVRYDMDQAFLNARFTLNLDDPLGFSFDEGKIWSLHLGGGGTF